MLCFCVFRVTFLSQSIEKPDRLYDRQPIAADICILFALCASAESVCPSSCYKFNLGMSCTLY
jgi:hypothetical protein